MEQTWALALNFNFSDYVTLFVRARIAAAEGRLVQEDDPATVLEDRVGRRDASEPAANHDRLGSREDSRHREKLRATSPPTLSHEGDVPALTSA